MSQTISSLRVRSRAIMHLISLAGIVGMLALSGWQLQRLQWKEALMARAADARTQAAADLTALPSEEEIPSLEFRTFRVRGTFVPDKEYHMGARFVRGKLGYSLFAPLQLAGSDQFVIVDRGWVPVEKKDIATRPETVPQGEQVFEAMLRLPPKARLFSPKNQPEKNFWFYADTAAMAADLGKPLAPFVLVATAPAPEGVPELQRPLPIPSDGAVEFRNDHLGYAVTWAMLALAIACMYGYWLRKNPKSSPNSTRH